MKFALMGEVVSKVLKYNIWTMLDQRRRRWADNVQVFFSDLTCPSAVSLCLHVKVGVVADVRVFLMESRQSSREAKIENDHYHLDLDKLVEVERDGATIDCHKLSVSTYVSVTRQSSQGKKRISSSASDTHRVLKSQVTSTFI